MSEITVADEITVLTPPPSRAQKILRGLGWTSLALGCLFIFTLLNLPHARIKNYIQGTLQQALNKSGMQLTTKETRLSLGLLGIGYEMQGVSLTKPPADAMLKMDEISVTPKLSALVFGRIGAKISIVDGNGILRASYAGKGSEMSISFDGEELNLGKIGALPYFAGVKGAAVLKAEGSVSGDFANPTSVNGTVKLHLSKIVIDSQTLMGFAVPRLSISDGLIDLTITQGKAVINTFRLGKAGGNDDIVANLTGDLQLASHLEGSALNLKAKFSLSQNILTAFSLIDAILGAGKLPDGSYSYTLNGPLMSPTPMPAR